MNKPLLAFELDSCPKHVSKKLAFFCPTCAELACQNCCSVDHTHHDCLDLGEAFLSFRPNLDDLLSKALVDAELLNCSLAETEKMATKVAEKQQEAISEVQKIFQALKDAVAQQEQEVIDQINVITSMHTDSLEKDKENIAQALESVRTLSQVGENVLREGNRSKALVSHHKLNSTLQSCCQLINSHSPSDFVLKTNILSVKSALKTVCLCITEPYPPLCSMMGKGLHYPLVNKLCTVILVAKDRAGQPCVEGGERLFVRLVSSVATVRGDYRDNSDGTYSINFRPHVEGKHQLVVTIRGQHVHGSPFAFVVDSGREHSQVGVVTQICSEGLQNEQFRNPWGICCDQLGNIIVSDRGSHRIHVFDINGNFKHKFGNKGVFPGEFNRPAGVAVTREGHVVVADKDNHRIQVMKIDGMFLFMFGSKGGNDGQMIYPYDVAVNQFDGRIAVTDTGNHRLLIFSHDGILLGKFGYKGYLCGHFDSPRGITFNDDGHIIISDFNVHHILVIHPDGTTARILGRQGSGNGQFMRPQGIAVDHMGNFIVADTCNNRIVIMHRSGHFVAEFSSSGSGPVQFDQPTSVAVLPDGRIAVVDFGNARVLIF
jgi:tripartite motif-containing protein 71